MPWLDELTVLALRDEVARQIAAGRDLQAAREAAQELLMGLHPSLPFPLLEDIAATTLLRAEGG